MPSNQSSFDEGVRRCIPSEFFMISGSEDSEEAEEVYNAASKFDLPNPRGKEGGLCTSLFLHTLYNNVHRVVTPHTKPAQPLTCHKLLQTMHATSRAKGYTPVPQMTASRPLLSTRPFYIVPPGYTGRRRALIIGINYTGQQGELRAPHNDAHNVREFLLRACGFDTQEVMVLVDDKEGKFNAPTKHNILTCLQQMVQYSRAGDTLVVSFSGHGGRVADKDGDEEDGFDSSLMPVDFEKAGQIVDDDILKYFIKGLPMGVHATMLVDACHCGSVGDLPYTLAATDRKHSIEQGFNMDTHEEALAKDKAAYEAQVERKRQKAERHKEREAIRQRRAEEEAREAAMTKQAQPKYSGEPVKVLQASSPAEFQALASRMGGMTLTSEQVAAMTKQGGGTISTGPIMMTPDQAAVFQAQHKGARVGTPVVMHGANSVVRLTTKTKAAPVTTQQKIKVGGSSHRSSSNSSPTKTKIPATTKTGPSPGGIAALRQKFGG